MVSPLGASRGAAASATVGIAGGHGGIGSLFARLLRADDVSVLISDRNTPLGNAELAARCDLSLVAVPLGATPAVLAEMAPRVPAGGALASLASLMEPAAPVMESCQGESFLLHPLFGPGRKELRGTTLTLASLRGGPRQQWLVSWLRRHGAQVVTTTPEQHDRIMAAAQALLLGSYAALAPEIVCALPTDDPLTWTTPNLRLQLGLMSRILHQDARLYGDLLALNRHTPAMLDALIGRLAALRDAVANGPDAVTAYFGAARDALGLSGPALAKEGDRALGEA